MRVRVVRYKVSLDKTEASRLQFEIGSKRGVYYARVYPAEAEVIFFPDQIDEEEIAKALGGEKLEEKEMNFEEIITGNYSK